ncbi:MAG: hypothetical protein Kow0077_08950 [Anaerolineae bacterium]
MIVGFDPDFDDATWTLDWLDWPIVQVPVGELAGGYRVEQEHVTRIEVFGRLYEMDPPLDVRGLYDPNGVLWMSDTPQERMMMYNNARQSHGHVLVGGAGLGLYPQYVTDAQSFTIVERSPVVMRLVGPLIQQVMAKRGVPVRFVLGDIEAYLRRDDPDSFDTIFIDTWERLDATMLPKINQLRDLAARHLAPGGHILLWGYRWMVRMFEEACATVLMMPPEERDAWLAAQEETNPRAVAMLSQIMAEFRGQTILRWELDSAVARCREWIITRTV